MDPVLVDFRQLLDLSGEVPSLEGEMIVESLGSTARSLKDDLDFDTRFRHLGADIMGCTGPGAAGPGRHARRHAAAPPQITLVQLWFIAS
jgi:hypothetical protein